MGASPACSGLLALLVCSAAAPAAMAQSVAAASAGGQQQEAPQRKDKLVGPYDVLTDTRSEVANLHPEVFSGITHDADGQLWAVNPYASTVVLYSAVTPVPDLIVPTGLHPVSIAIWDPASPVERKLLVACVGTHALMVHDPADGRVENVIQLESEPGDLVVDPDNARAFVACQGSNRVLQVNLATMRIEARHEMPCGERPGFLYLDRGNLALDGDNRVYVAQSVTGNNSLPLGAGGGSVGVVFDLDGFPGGELPDEDVFRINPENGAVDAVVRGAGSMLFQLARNPVTQDLWLLSTDSNNKDATIDSEPKLNGQVAINQLLQVPGVTANSGLVQAGPGLDLDDYDSATAGPQYDAARSVNQARAIDVLPGGSLAPGVAFVASPMSDVIPILDSTGARILEFHLPPGAQCYDVDIFDPADTLVSALCLGTMTIELFQWSPFGQQPFASLPLGLDPTPSQIRRGRDVFLDGQRSRDGRFTCGTCHPGGRSDQLGWMLRGDPCDQKDVMVTQSLLSIADTFPHHWRGERDLGNFIVAFGGLLGAPEAEVPTEAEMEDFIVFMQTLQAPANPIQNPRRVLDDARGTQVAPNGVSGSAVLGQRWFQEVPNFNGSTCEGCHTQVTGSNAAFFEEVGTNAPRAGALETAHLRQLQHKGSKTTFIDFGGPGPREFNANGFGVAHNGRIPTLFNFIVDIGVFFTLNLQQRTDVFRFVEQFDQGISPAAHWAAWFEETSGAGVPARINQVLLQGAVAGWNDVAVFGEYDSGGGLEPMRWYFEPGSETFVAEDPSVPPVDWDQMIVDTRAGRARGAFVGLPLGNGRRFGIDHDGDGLSNGVEEALGTDPWNPDSDGDSWPDGYEDANGGDPLQALTLPVDSTPPSMTRIALDHATSRTAKYHVQFSEPVTYQVEYNPAGSERLYTFEREFLTADDSFVLTHSDPGTPTFPAILFDARLTMTDRSGNATGPIALPGFSPLEAGLMQAPFLPNMHVAEMEWLSEVRNGSTLEADVRIKINSNYGAPDFIPGANQMVFCIVSVWDEGLGRFVQSTDFTTPQRTTFSTVNAEDEIEPYEGDPGPPWIVSPFTDAQGETSIQFDQPGLLQGQTVKVSVMGILVEGTPPDGYSGPPLYERISLFQMTPLLTEVTQELRTDF